MRWLIILGVLIFCALYAAIAFAYKGFRFNRTKKDDSELELEFVLDDYMLRHETVDQQTYCTIQFESGELLTKEGYAELPFLHSFFDLPAAGDFNAKVVSSEYKDYNLNHPMLPGRGDKNRAERPEMFPFNINPNSVEDKWYPGPLSHITNPFVQNGQRGADLYLYPFQYNSVNQTLRVHEKVKVRLFAEDMEKNETADVAVLNNVSLNDMVYRSTFFNRSFNRSFHSLTRSKAKEILIIHSRADTEKVKPYVDWKKEKGFNVQTQKESKGIRVKDIIAQAFEANENLSYVQLVGDWGDIRSEKRVSQHSPVAPMLDNTLKEKADPANYLNAPLDDGSLSTESTEWEDPFHFDEKALDDDTFNDVIIDTDEDIDNSSNPFLSSKQKGGEKRYDLVQYKEPSKTGEILQGEQSGLLVPPLIKKEKPPILFSLSCYSGMIQNTPEKHAGPEMKRHREFNIEKPPLATVTQPWLPLFGARDKMECLLYDCRDESQEFDDLHPMLREQKGFDTTLFLASQVGDRVVFEPEESVVKVVKGKNGGKPNPVASEPVIRESIKITHPSAMVDVPLTVTIKGKSGMIKDVLVVLSQNHHHYVAITNDVGMATIHHKMKTGRAMIVVSGLTIVSEQVKIFVNPDPKKAKKKIVYSKKNGGMG